MPIMTILALTNMTDVLVETFGLDFMQLLWDPLMVLFDALEVVFPNSVDAITTLWEVLFA